MVDLYNAEAQRVIGTISEADLQILIDALEEESSEDQDYYIDASTIDMLADRNAPAHLLELLRAALGSSEGIDIRWEQR